MLSLEETAVVSAETCSATVLVTAEEEDLSNELVSNYSIGTCNRELTSYDAGGWGLGDCNVLGACEHNRSSLAGRLLSDSSGVLNTRSICILSAGDWIWDTLRSGSSPNRARYTNGTIMSDSGCQGDCVMGGRSRASGGNGSPENRRFEPAAGISSNGENIALDGTGRCDSGGGSSICSDSGLCMRSRPKCNGDSLIDWTDRGV